MDNEGQVTSSAHTQAQGLPGQSRKLRLQVHHTEFARVSGAAATGRVVTGAQAQVSCRLLNRELANHDWKFGRFHGHGGQMVGVLGKRKFHHYCMNFIFRSILVILSNSSSLLLNEVHISVHSCFSPFLVNS